MAKILYGTIVALFTLAIGKSIYLLKVKRTGSAFSMFQINTFTWDILKMG